MQKEDPFLKALLETLETHGSKFVSWHITKRNNEARGIEDDYRPYFEKIKEETKNERTK